MRIVRTTKINFIVGCAIAARASCTLPSYRSRLLPVFDVLFFRPLARHPQGLNSTELFPGAGIYQCLPIAFEPRSR